MNTLAELWAIFVALWNTGNRIARAAILLIVLWPALVAVIALIGFPAITSIVALVPVMAIALSIVAAIDPIVIAVIAAFKKGRTVFTWIATIIAMELVLGVYFSVVPIWNDRGLVPVVVLVAVAMFFLAVGVKGKTQKTAIGVMFVIIVILTAIFFLGGREKVVAKFESTPTKTSAAAVSIPIESFTLRIGEPIQTVLNGPGTTHKLLSGKPFKAVSVQSDGRIIKYDMPAGISYWNGANPPGKLGLEGLEADTVVEIIRIS